MKSFNLSHKHLRIPSSAAITIFLTREEEVSEGHHDKMMDVCTRPRSTRPWRDKFINPSFNACQSGSISKKNTPNIGFKMSVAVLLCSLIVFLASVRFPWYICLLWFSLNFLRPLPFLVLLSGYVFMKGKATIDFMSDLTIIDKYWGIA